MTAGGRRLRCRSHDGGCGGRRRRHRSHRLRSRRLRRPAIAIEVEGSETKVTQVTKVTTIRSRVLQNEKCYTTINKYSYSTAPHLR